MFQAIWKKVVPKSKFQNLSFGPKKPQTVLLPTQKKPRVLKIQECYLVAGLVKSTNPTSFLGWARSNLYRYNNHYITTIISPWPSRAYPTAPRHTGQAKETLRIHRGIRQAQRCREARAAPEDGKPQQQPGQWQRLIALINVRSP